MEEIARQAGWAKTFGLPLELDLAHRSAGALPADDDRRRPGSGVPSDGRLRRSQPAHVRARRRCAAARARRSSSELASPAIRVAEGGSTAVETDRGEIETEIVVNAGGMYAREIGALAGVNVPIVPMAHEYLITKPAGLPAGHADDARPFAARVLPPGVGRAGHGRVRAALRAVGARRHSRRLQLAACSRRTGHVSRS